MKKILIMAGGTGGHVIPALTIAESLRTKGMTVEWIGSRDSMEADLVSRVNIPIHFIARVPLRQRRIKSLLTAPWRLLGALWQAIKIIKTTNPDVVLGMGGYVSFPGGVAAWLLRKPFVIHEQNAVAGLANRWLAKIAKQRFQAFPHIFSNGITVGNPIRTTLLNIAEPQQRLASQQAKLKLLIVGGSQGAVAINKVMVAAMALMPAAERPDIWHLTGKGKMTDVVANYEKIQLPARVEEFCHDMADAYQWADVVLCRSGALTVSEIAAIGVASILVPYPHSMDDHQVLHAEYLAKSKAAIMIAEKELTAERLKKVLSDLQQNRSQCLTMAIAARELGQRDATDKIVEGLRFFLPSPCAA